MPLPVPRVAEEAPIAEGIFVAALEGGSDVFDVVRDFHKTNPSDRSQRANLARSGSA
jgi:hypothetical protein